MTAAVATLHAFATLAMVGLIWFVQIVHYPLFLRLEPASSVVYAEAHQRRTTRVVAPLMLLEASTALWLVWVPPPGVWQTWPLVAFGLLVLIWLSTAFVQIPCHARLARGFDSTVVRRLVHTNWLRTVAWTARGVFALQFMQAGSEA